MSPSRKQGMRKAVKTIVGLNKHLRPKDLHFFGLFIFIKGDENMPNRKRASVVTFHVTTEEKNLIADKMAAAGIINREAYLRKMALGGYVVHMDLSSVKEMTRLLSNATNNLNQVAKRANETRSIYESDIKDLQADYEKLWVQAADILKLLSKASK